tara:strand:+ start:157 stop:966 length:810 start_codon:yes stop_codon:yes gene_type:complete
MPKVLNNLEMRVFAMMRSGHHAIISWIIRASDHSVYFRNDVLEANILNKTSVANEKKGDVSLNRGKYIFNIEDAPLRNADIIIDRNRRLLSSGHSKAIKNVVIIRDPFNLFASRLAFERNILKNSNSKKIKYANYIGAVGWADSKSIKMWIDYAKVYLGLKSHLKGGAIGINYDLWFNNIEYREGLCDKLYLNKNVLDVGKLSKYGRGSSFDGQEFEGGANKMNCLYRWRNFLNDKEYIDLFRGNTELFELYNKIYGEIPPDIKSLVGG